MTDNVIVADPEILWGMPVIKGTRVLVYDLAASVKAGIARDRILAAYPTIREHHLDLAVAYAAANPLKKHVARATRGEDPQRGQSTDETYPALDHGHGTATKDSQVEPLRMRISTQMTVDVDQVFTPYTALITDPLVVEAIAHLESKIKRLRSLEGSEPEIATVIGKATEAFGKAGVLWLVEYNQVLQAVPLDLILQGETESVLTLIGQIEYGVYV
ncbi:DUF433 domain-containing protein [Microvirga calopogonii]|uniref:DUF433 domain-containing protein n=1 Tax=Microvirga calopogonii TaxID=2078013 RepID=UPI0013B4639C|nr:DUF433 domain-containing protein [Microvirga calopogonii]